MPGSESTPQVAIVASVPDRPRIKPLVTRLRDNGIRVWWDAELIPGDEWDLLTIAAVRQAPITCVVLSASPMSADFSKVLTEIINVKKQLVPIRLSKTLPAGHLQDFFRNRIWMEFFEPSDLDRVVEELVRTVRSVRGRESEPSTPSPETGPTNAPPSRRIPRQSPDVPPSGRIPRQRGDAPPSVALVLGDATSPETWPIGQGLRDVLVDATRRPGDAQFPISFSTLLAALFQADGLWPTWCSTLGRSSGFKLAELLPILVSPPTIPEPFRTTRSAASLLTSARGFARHSGTPLDVHHVVAALIYEPAGHDVELERLGFDRVIWANALIDEAGRRSPGDAALFTTLRDKAFPVGGGEPPVWALANTQVKNAFGWAWAAAQATPSDQGAVGVRELLVGLLREADTPQFREILFSVAPGLAPTSSEPWWEPTYRKLDVPLPSATTAPVLDALTPHTADVDAVRSKAMALSGRLTPSGSELLSGWFFLALWQPDGAGEAAAIDPLLPVLAIDSDALLQELRDFMAAQGDGTAAQGVVQAIEDIRTLRRRLLPWERPHVDNDRIGDRITEDQDRLDVRKPAARFAKLLAARNVHPPIALGLFGNWGSGKSFFMGLMRDRIDTLQGSGPEYVGRAVQIEFNAWHYHDTNLWASLAIRIFEGIARELAGPKEDEIQAKRKELHQKVRSSEARRHEAEKQRDLALERRVTAVKSLEGIRAERDAKYKESVGLRLQAAWDVVKQDDNFKELRATADKLLNHFGISKAIESVDDLQRLRRDIDETSGRALGLFTAVGHRFQDLGTGARTTGLLVLVAGGALALGFGHEHLARLLQYRTPPFSGTVLEVAALLSTASAWCGRRVKEIRGAIDQIGNVEAALVKAEKRAPSSKAIEDLEKTIADLDKQIHQAGEVVSAADREIAEATAEIDRINRGGLVYDFLQERQASASYVGQLGLISTIRQDLDRLGALLKDFTEKGTKPIERIILYIDDLDRCHPDKVVEVLQAVHLLLAFDLFNVVVGVDARWLERSLRRQYVGRGRKTRIPGDDSFSPQDYLEKIFQIPYALSPIDQNGFKGLVNGLIETRSEHMEKERQRARDEAARLAAAEQRKVQEEALKADKPPQGDTTAPKKSEDTDTARTIPEAGGAKDGQTPPTAGAPPALFLEDHEEKFIQELYEFIDRPRLTKRFINIYRLLRVRADDEGETAKFAGSAGSPQYRAALILLAIYVGHPTVAAKVMYAIDRAAKHATWPDVVTQLEQDQIPGVVLSERERGEVAAVAAKLARIAPRVPTELEAYRSWVPRVGCYSFDWHRAEALTAARRPNSPAPVEAPPTVS